MAQIISNKVCCNRGDAVFGESGSVSSITLAQAVVIAVQVVSGALWKGLALIAYGVLVIGLVDNLLRPILIGKDTRMPDYIVMITTLGGMAVFGINGFVLGPVIAAMFIAVWQIQVSTLPEQ